MLTFVVNIQKMSPTKQIVCSNFNHLQFMVPENLLEIQTQNKQSWHLTGN